MSEKKAKLFEFVIETHSLFGIVTGEIIRAQYNQGDPVALAGKVALVLEIKKHIHNLSVVLKQRATKEGFRKAVFVGELLKNLKEAEDKIVNVTSETWERIIASDITLNMSRMPYLILDDILVKMGIERPGFGIPRLEDDDPKITAAKIEIYSERALVYEEPAFDPADDVDFAEMYPENFLEGGVKRKQKSYRRKSIRSKRKGSRKSKRRNSRRKN